MDYLIDTSRLSGTGASRSPPAFVPRPAIAARGNPAPPAEIRSHSAAEVDAWLRTQQRSVSFQVDGETGLTIAHVYKNATGELVRQIPTEEIVRIARFLQQMDIAPVIDTVA